jgi:hypothetical protein
VGKNKPKPGTYSSILILKGVKKNNSEKSCLVEYTAV